MRIGVKMIKKVVFLFLVILLIPACAKWQVSELQKKVLFQIGTGENPGTIDFETNEHGFLDLTFDIRISNEMVLCSDNKQKRFQIFDLDGKPTLSIGSLPNQQNSSIQKNDGIETVDENNSELEPESVEDTGAEQVTFDFTTVDFSFGQIGKFVADNEGKIYIENTVLPVNEESSNNQSNIVGLSPSFILVFNNEGKILYSLGKDGSSEVPFHSIYQMYTDKNNRLFVISKSSENWSVYRYNGKELTFDLHLERSMFKETDDVTEYEGLVENIVIFNSGNKLLVSVAYYDTTRFKYRKIYEYLINENKLGKALLHLPDPKNELFSILEDQYIIVWDIEKSDLRFSIWNLQESIVNNKKIPRPDFQPLYEKVLADEAGRLYTILVQESKIKIEEWK
jgi:hypothetical protein